MDSVIKNSEEFKNLYQRISDDEEVREMDNATGITIVRNYKKDSEYFKDGKQMLIRLYLKAGFLLGSIEMVEKIDEGKYRVICNNKKYKRRFTNFFWGTEEDIRFISENGKIFVKIDNKKLSLNKFIDKIVENHLSDRLFWIRIINIFKKLFLQILFFLSDDKYDFVNYSYKIYLKEKNFNKENEKIELGIKEEPFFKYFKIYKNTLFIFSIIALLILLFLKRNKVLLREDLTLSNPILVLSSVIILFLLHYFIFLFLFTKRRKKKMAGYIKSIRVYLLINSNLEFNK